MFFTPWKPIFGKHGKIFSRGGFLPIAGPGALIKRVKYFMVWYYSTYKQVYSQGWEVNEEKIMWSVNLLGISFKQWEVFLQDSWAVFAQHSRCTDLQSFKKYLCTFVTKCVKKIDFSRDLYRRKRGLEISWHCLVSKSTDFWKEDSMEKFLKNLAKDIVWSGN